MARNFTAAANKCDWGDIGRLDGLSVLTVAFRLFLSTGGTTRTFISKQSAGAFSASTLIIRSGSPDSDDLIFAVGDGTNAMVKQTTTNALATGAWMNFVCVWSGGTSGAVYKDGASQTLSDASSGTPTTLAATTASFTYGQSSAGVDGFDGSLAEVGIWPVAFSAADVASYAAGVSPLCIRASQLELYSPLWGRNSPELDLITPSEGTLTGTQSSNHPRVIYKQRRSRVYQVPRTINIHTSRVDKQRAKVLEPVPEYVW